MDFKIDDKQKEICSAIENVAKKKLNDNILQDDHEGKFSLEKWKICADLGIQGLSVPEQFGGLGFDMLTTALAIKSLSSACQDEGLVFSICAHICTCIIPILQFGTTEQKEKYLPLLVNGNAIGGNGITESNAGSDSLSIQTMVEKNNSGFILNGNKLFVTNAPVADLLIIYAKHSNGMRGCNLSAFIIEKDNPGMCIGQLFDKMGLRTSTMSEVVLKNCNLGKDALLGREMLGLAVFNKSMIWERIIMASYHIGAMEQQYSALLNYVNSRQQFGKKLLEFQSIANTLVDMKIKIESSRLMLYYICTKYDSGHVDINDVSMLKIIASESKVQNSLKALQMYGAYGYLKEGSVERQLRDSLASTIYSGTTEIQKKIVAEKLELME